MDDDGHPRRVTSSADTVKHGYKAPDSSENFLKVRNFSRKREPKRYQQKYSRHPLRWEDYMNTL